LEEEITAAWRDGEIADLVDDEQREAAVVADPLAKSAVAALVSVATMLASELK
jgi:hypothetical protein